MTGGVYVSGDKATVLLVGCEGGKLEKSLCLVWDTPVSRPMTRGRDVFLSSVRGYFEQEVPGGLG